MSKDKQPFNRAVFVPIKDLPDHSHQAITDLCSWILMQATIKNVTGHMTRNEPAELHDFNVSLGAMQKAFGLLIAKFFKKDKLEDVIEQACDALARNAREWSDADE